MASSLTIPYQQQYRSILEGSVLLCNDYRLASATARSESWGEVDVQVDSYARIIPHRKDTAVYSESPGSLSGLG